MPWLALLCLWLAIGFAGQAARAAEPAPDNAPAASYQALADLLENDKARADLIERLRTLASEPADGAAAAPAPASSQPAASPVPGASLPGRIAGNVQRFLGGLVDDVLLAGAATRAFLTDSTGRGQGVSAWRQPFWQLLGVIAATCLAFVLLRIWAAGLYRRLDSVLAGGTLRFPAAPDGAALQATSTAAATPNGSVPPQIPRSSHAPLGLAFRAWWRRTGVILGAFAIDLASVALAALAGYAVSVALGMEFQAGGALAILFVNAFLAVEMARAFLRLLFATRYGNLRLFAMSDDMARYWNRWLAILVSVTGYGLLFAVPAIEQMLAPAAARVLGLVLMLMVYVYAVRVAWGKRQVLRDHLNRRADAATTPYFGTLLRVAARLWHVVAIAYFTVLLVVSQVDPGHALPFMVSATLQTTLAMLGGVLLSGLLTALLARRVHLSDTVRVRFPTLEMRVNSYVPMVVRGLRTAVLVIVVLLVLDAWRAFDLSAWLASDSGSRALVTVAHIAIILLSAVVAWTLVASIIEHRLSPGEGFTGPTARERTLLALFRNAAMIVIATMTIMVLLSQIGVDIAPLIAGAGVVGLAIGFGAQKLVQDIITGIFIQLENGMNQNDVVEVAGIFGTVEKITIRSVGIRTLDGGYHMIPFSSVDRVSNHMRDFSYHLGEYTITYQDSVDDAMRCMEAAFAELMQDPELAPQIMEPITIPGVTTLNERGVTIRVLVKTQPGMQWAVQRAYNRLLKAQFGQAGIAFSYPQTVMHFAHDEGNRLKPAD